ncbi:MAG: hypothetical protein M0C28_14090 [Candidatus Moduliflexus flocculans]|nr:hypothetical protein [Candidatus Moduliflexus flocculans]
MRVRLFDFFVFFAIFVKQRLRVLGRGGKSSPASQAISLQREGIAAQSISRRYLQC